ncbi:uncharacterized protein LOC133199788 [Saccostrea echinata]|uniref:uncharacterized protein LOC133199788 n=1 Tax=Saccostrea echinata TaxID=191078 RepID=UPI002A82A1F0|nr:uncharacterized protein LOC133199788 [Saccostrea echinata]
MDDYGSSEDILCNDEINFRHFLKDGAIVKKRIDKYIAENGDCRSCDFCKKQYSLRTKFVHENHCLVKLAKESKMDPLKMATFCLRACDLEDVSLEEPMEFSEVLKTIMAEQLDNDADDDDDPFELKSKKENRLEVETDENPVTAHEYVPQNNEDLVASYLAKSSTELLHNCAVADEATAIKCTIYDNTKFARFMEGSSVILRNFIKKVDSIAVTTTTKLFPCNDVNVPQDISNRARILLNLPSAPTKPVSEALNSPPRVRVSIKGRIMQEEATREVFVKEERVKVKNIYIEDSTSKCKVALWHNFAEKDIRPGDYVQITDVVTNTFRNEVSLTTTAKSKITKTDCPAEVKIYQAISGYLDGDDVTFLLQDDSILSIPYELVEVALPDVKKNELESHILGKCKPTVSLRCTSKGSKFTSVEIM